MFKPAWNKSPLLSDLYGTDQTHYFLLVSTESSFLIKERLLLTRNEISHPFMYSLKKNNYMLLYNKNRNRLLLIERMSSLFESVVLKG